MNETSKFAYFIFVTASILIILGYRPDMFLYGTVLVLITFIAENEEKVNYLEDQIHMLSKRINTNKSQCNS